MDSKPTPMKKPKYKIGQLVYVNFLGSPKLSRLTELRGKHGRDQDRWIYYAVDVNDGTVYPNVGVGNSEKTFNINVEKTKELL